MFIACGKQRFWQDRSLIGLLREGPISHFDCWLYIVHIDHNLFPLATYQVSLDLH